MLKRRTHSRRHSAIARMACLIVESLEPKTLLTGIIHTIDFEDIGGTLASESGFDGPVAGGTAQDGPFGDTIVVGDIVVQDLLFNNTKSVDYGSWSGWAYSNRTDSTTEGFSNQLSSLSGGGADDSATYGVSFVSSVEPLGPPTITLPVSDAREFRSLKVNNTAYAGLSMTNGDGFAKKFGGDDGTDQDWLLLTITGKDPDNVAIGTIEFYLADYRFSDGDMDYVVDEWTEIDASPLSTAQSLEFSLTSTDNGSFGMNTPAYFAIDDIVLEEPPPTTDLAATAFDAVNDHILTGETDVTYTISNLGKLAAGPFATHVVWSLNDIVGDDDDIILSGSERTYAGIDGDGTIDATIPVSLDRASLLSHAIASTPEGGAEGTVSTESSQLFLVVDTDNAVEEIDEANNAVVDRGVSSDDITYFPWDTNSNGAVESQEATNSVQSIGSDDAAGDLNGDGIVSPLEALSAVRRVGYLRNEAVINDGSRAPRRTAVVASVFVQDASPAPIKVLSSATSSSAPVFATPVVLRSAVCASPVFIVAAEVASHTNSDDEQKTGLFEADDESRATQTANATESGDSAIDHAAFVGTIDWLSVI